MRSPTFRLTDLLKIDARAAAPLAAVSLPDIFDRLDHIDAETFLKSINFPEAARHLAFEVFSRSFFASPTELSAAELATMFHIYFLGSSEGLIFDVANSNFDTALWEPLRQYLIGLGVRFHQGVSVSSVARGDGQTFHVHTDAGDQLDADAVVLATDIAGLQRIVEASPGLGDDLWRARIKRLRTAPPFMVQRLWLDRPVAADRAAFLGTSGHEPVDNISVLDRYERQATDWARRTGGSVVELHSYAVRIRAAARRDARANCTSSTRRPAARGSSTNDAAAPRLPALRAGHLRAPAQRRDPAAGAAAGRRRNAHRLTGGADGARGHHRLDRRQRDTAAVGPRRPRTVDGSHPGPFGAAALSRRPRKAFATMNIGDNVRRRWPKDWPLQPIPPGTWTGQRPTYRDASPAIINAALDRSQRRPTGNWYTFAASRDVRSDKPLGTPSPASSWSPGVISSPGCASAPAVARISAPTWRRPRCTTAT